MQNLVQAPQDPSPQPNYVPVRSGPSAEPTRHAFLIGGNASSLAVQSESNSPYHNVLEAAAAEVRLEIREGAERPGCRGGLRHLCEHLQCCDGGSRRGQAWPDPGEAVVIALDAGVVWIPDGLRQQAEGSVVMGMGYALYEEVRFQVGKVLNAISMITRLRASQNRDRTGG